MVSVTQILVNGLPGKMAAETAKAIVESSDFTLHECALAGRGIDSGNGGKNFYIGEQRVRLYGPVDLPLLEEAFTGKFAVDYTVPSAGAVNAEFYARNRMPFVMGTTSTDDNRVVEAVRRHGTIAVKGANMGLQIVAFQRFVQQYAKAYPKALEGRLLAITESHQAKKKDTSGTAKSMVMQPDGTPGYFNQLGMDFTVDQIRKVRDPAGSNMLGVPPEFMDAHGYHTYEIRGNPDDESLEMLAFGFVDLLHTPIFSKYSLTSDVREDIDVIATSPTKDVVFSVNYNPLDFEKKSRLRISHNVNGRKVYADGTLEALRFLQAAEYSEKSQGQVFNMIDVLNWIEARAV